MVVVCIKVKAEALANNKGCSLVDRLAVNGVHFSVLTHDLAGIQLRTVC